MIESLCVFNILHCIISIFYLDTRQLGAIRLMDRNGAGKPDTSHGRSPFSTAAPASASASRWSRVKKNAGEERQYNDLTPGAPTEYLQVTLVLDAWSRDRLFPYPASPTLW